MNFLLGIDLGTSGVKAMLLNADTGDTFVESSSYPVDIPQPGYAEQNPEMWWEYLAGILRKLKQRCPEEYGMVRSIGFSGQMHGLVMVDRRGNPLRPAIVALDQRTGKQISEINDSLTIQELGEIFHNRPCAGFALPSLLWVKEHQPDILKQTYRIFQPKDYIRYRMTGKMGSDYTDASATLAFDTGKGDWAWDILTRFGLPHDIFPQCRESQEISGTVTAACAKETGLAEGTPVVYGCGDQMAQSIGNGVVREGAFVSNIGTSGQISTYLKRDTYDPELRTHTFRHAFNQAFTVFGASLCSGMSLNWLKNKVLHLSDYADLDRLAMGVPAGSDGVIFLPYLVGERTPHMDHNASGMFFGLRLGHDRSHMIRAVMEGVVYSLKNSLDIFSDLGIEPRQILASGGGARSPLWLQMQADIYEKEILVCDAKEQACLGASILAGVGAGLFSSVSEACHRFVHTREERYYPDPGRFEIYRAGYSRYNRLYQQCKELMRDET